MKIQRSFKNERLTFCFVTLIVMAACSTDPGEPESRYAVSGKVLLAGTSRDAQGFELGSIVVDDASGVVVRLFRGATLVATTSTIAGEYTFAAVIPGTYRAYSWVTLSAGDSTSLISVTNGDVQALDTLLLSSMGSLIAQPNPTFAPSDSSRLTFTVAQSGDVLLDIIAPDSNLVRSLIDAFINAGQKRNAIWDGTDNDSLGVAPGPYWAVYESGGVFENELVVRE